MKNRQLIVISVLALTACSKHARAPQLQQVSFAAQGSILYREDANGRTPLLALDSATAPTGVAIAPTQWSPAPGSTFGVAAKTFRYVVPSPGRDWVAWETSGAVHDLLGVLPAEGGTLTVLDFFFDSSADSLAWAPAGRYLTAFYMPPSGVGQVRVYDAVQGKRVK